MSVRLRAQLHEIRLDLQDRRLRRQERIARRRLGELIAARRDGCEREDVARLAAELMQERRHLEAFGVELAASLEADRSDLDRVSRWLKPVVIARGACARAVLRHRRAAAERALHPRYEALGALAASTARGESFDLAGTRAALERLRVERERRLAAFDGTAHPGWVTTAAAESAGLARAIIRQLQSTLVPKTPALAGMVVGWWIANTYTDSRVRSALRSVGLGQGGTHVVSGSTYKAMNFWLPLLAAAVCAYLGERLVRSYRERQGRREPV